MKDCIVFRKEADEPDGSARFQKHMESCEDCKAWHRRNEEVVAMVGAMPQFDVSEALTQSIMSAVEAQPRRSIANALLAPLAVATVALSCTIMPIDTAEGLMSTAIGLAGLYLIYLVVKSTPHEEVTT